MGKARVQVYLDESDLEYIRNVRELVGLDSDSEAVRFCIKLLRLLLPRASYVAQIVMRLIESESTGSS